MYHSENEKCCTDLELAIMVEVFGCYCTLEMAAFDTADDMWLTPTSASSSSRSACEHVV